MERGLSVYGRGYLSGGEGGGLLSPLIVFLYVCVCCVCVVCLV